MHNNGTPVYNPAFGALSPSVMFGADKPDKKNLVKLPPIIKQEEGEEVVEPTSDDIARWCLGLMMSPVYQRYLHPLLKEAASPERRFPTDFDGLLAMGSANAVAVFAQGLIETIEKNAKQSQPHNSEEI